jgi:hypothetical protein
MRRIQSQKRICGDKTALRRIRVINLAGRGAEMRYRHHYFFPLFLLFDVADPGIELVASAAVGLVRKKIAPRSGWHGVCFCITAFAAWSRLGDFKRQPIALYAHNFRAVN